MIPYGLALPIACVALAAAYAFEADAPRLSRLVIGLLAIATIVVPVPDGPAWRIVVVLSQLAISLFVLLHRIARRA